MGCENDPQQRVSKLAEKSRKIVSPKTKARVFWLFLYKMARNVWLSNRIFRFFHESSKYP